MRFSNAGLQRKALFSVPKLSARQPRAAQGRASFHAVKRAGENETPRRKEAESDPPAETEPSEQELVCSDVLLRKFVHLKLTASF